MADRSKVLIVEDSLLISMDEQAMVEACGCAVVGPVASVEEALALIGTERLSAAVLDVNLGEDCVWPVAAALDERGVPFVLATGYADPEIPARYRSRPLLAKPLGVAALKGRLEEIGAIGA